jgi:hypothetical protein
MKLTAPWVDQTQTQFDVQALPDDHPATEKLHEAFGVHTFFVGDDGLHIVQEIEPPRAETAERAVVRLASWRDAQRSTLEIHEPELVGTVAMVEKDGNRRARSN